MENEGRLKYVYVLYDPSTLEIKYVGQSFKPQHRVYNHAKAKNNSEIYRWALSLRNIRQVPQHIVLARCTIREAEKIELLWILYFRSLGMRLFNDLGKTKASLKYIIWEWLPKEDLPS